MASCGRFIEIAKRNIWTHDRMQRERPDIQYHTHSLNELLPSEPERLVPMLQQLTASVEAGESQPLPLKVFEMRGELVQAFRWLQSGKAIGKVVVRIEPPPQLSQVKGQGCVLVTGGLGGLGIVTAEALVEAGARCVVLSSRSGKVKRSDQGLQERLDALQSTSGAQVVVEQCDMDDEADVVALLERARDGFGPLRAVVHTAGVLSDALLPKQDAASMQRVWGPKAGIMKACDPV